MWLLAVLLLCPTPPKELRNPLPLTLRNPFDPSAVCQHDLRDPFTARDLKIPRALEPRHASLRIPDELR